MTIRTILISAMLVGCGGADFAATVLPPAGEASPFQREPQEPAPDAPLAAPDAFGLTSGEAGAEDAPAAPTEAGKADAMAPLPDADAGGDAAPVDRSTDGAPDAPVDARPAWCPPAEALADPGTAHMYCTTRWKPLGLDGAKDCGVVHTVCGDIDCTDAQGCAQGNCGGGGVPNQCGNDCLPEADPEWMIACGKHPGVQPWVHAYGRYCQQPSASPPDRCVHFSDVVCCAA